MWSMTKNIYLIGFDALKSSTPSGSLSYFLHCSINVTSLRDVMHDTSVSFFCLTESTLGLKFFYPNFPSGKNNAKVSALVNILAFGFALIKP
jgi:hypothetical protein